METSIERNGEELLVTLQGRLDTTTSPEAEKLIFENLNGVSHLILEFENLRYISSSGLRVLLSAQKKLIQNHATMTILHANELIMEIFEATGFLDIFEIKND